MFLADPLLPQVPDHQLVIDGVDTLVIFFVHHQPCPGGPPVSDLFVFLLASVPYELPVMTVVLDVEGHTIFTTEVLDGIQAILYIELMTQATQFFAAAMSRRMEDVALAERLGAWLCFSFAHYPLDSYRQKSGSGGPTMIRITMARIEDRKHRPRKMAVANRTYS